MNAETFVSKLSEININNFYGVPDSLMSSLSKYLEINDNHRYDHKILHNEGGAVGIAIGKYVSKGEISAVYLQNSGLGNVINPITSLTNKEVFSIPTLYVIGWRGKPDSEDEPQHKMQGRITIDLLKLLEINFLILENDEDLDLKIIEEHLLNKKSFALLVTKNFFDKDSRDFPKNQNELYRNKVLEKIYSTYENSLFISTTGKTSRELYEISKEDNFKNSFFTVGGMGHSSSIALGIAESNQDKQIICLDGDGSLLMHMGAISIIGNSPITNFHYVLLNNFAHESVGGQPTISNKINFEKLSSANNFEEFISIKSNADLEKYLKNLKDYIGKKIFIEIFVEIHSDKNLPRPDLKPSEYISMFNI